MRELLAVAALLSLPVPPTWKVVVNGQPLRDEAVLVRGQTYVSLDALQALGVPVVFAGRELWLGPAARPTRKGTAPSRPMTNTTDVRRPQNARTAVPPTPVQAR